MSAAPVLTSAEIAGLQQLAVRLDRPVGAGFAGDHRSRQHGRSTDFADWREYQPGDDPRSIDVQAWARLDQVLVRLFEADVDLSVQVLVDTSASMSIGGKHRQAVRVSAALAALALARNESVSVSRLLDPVPRRFRGRSAIPEMLAMIGGWQPAGPTNLAERARALMVMPRRTGLLIVISDFLTADWSAAFDQLSGRKELLLAVGVLSPEEDSPDLAGEVQLVDIETGTRVDVDLDPQQIAAFSQRRVDLRRAMEAQVTRRGGRWIAVNANQDLMSSVIPSLLGTGVTR